MPHTMTTQIYVRFLRSIYLLDTYQPFASPLYIYKKLTNSCVAFSYIVWSALFIFPWSDLKLWSNESLLYWTTSMISDMKVSLLAAIIFWYSILKIQSNKITSNYLWIYISPMLLKIKIKWFMSNMTSIHKASDTHFLIINLTILTPIHIMFMTPSCNEKYD